jgi:hypothetical protein
MKKAPLAAIGVFLAALTAMAAYPEFPGTKALALEPGTELYVMNGRLGSRHFFALDLKSGRADVGPMGFDQSIPLPREARHQRSVDLEVMLNNHSLYAKSSSMLLKERSLGLGLTYSCARGTGPSGLVLNHCVVSPMAFAKTLDDEDKLKTAISPFFYHRLTVENPTGKAQSAEVVFALGGKGKKPRTLTDGWQIIEIPEGRTNRHSCEPPRHALAASGVDSWIISGKKNGFVFNISVDPGASATRTVVQAGYTDQPVMKSRLEKAKYKFYYTRFFSSLEEVMLYAVDERDAVISLTEETESILGGADLSPERKWLMGLTFHTWLCNTWLVDGPGGPRYYVWEGDYAMLSTIDVAHEIETLAYFMPWTLKLQLEQWADNQLESEWGPYLAHDVGRDQVCDNPWYERKYNSLIGLPPMPVEENANYALLMHWYDFLTGDKETITGLLPVMEKMLLASLSRDTDGNGIADHDTGTTYDTSDALHVSKNNVYLGIKQMTAYLVGADLLERYGRKDKVETLRAEAKKILNTLLDANDQHDYLPTSLDTSYDGWDQASVVLGDALLYPSLTGFRTPELETLKPILTDNFEKALEKSRRSYGVVMTESEGDIFFSKVMVMEPVSAYFYEKPAELWQGPYEWNINNDKAYNDGAYSATRDWTGYKYSRGVISMWPLLAGPK